MKASVPSGGGFVTQRFPGNSEKQVDDTQDNRSEERGKKADNLETRDNGRGKLEHQGIDHEPEQPDRHNREGERENLQDKTDRRIDNADDNRRHQRDAEAADLKSWHDPSDNEKSDSTQQPVQQEICHEFTGLENSHYVGDRQGKRRGSGGTPGRSQ